MSFKGVNTNKLNGGLGREEPQNDGINALVYVVPTADLPVGTAHNTFYKLFEASDVDDLGFTAAWDASETSLVNHMVNSHFDYSPEQPIYLVVVADSQTPAQILALAAFRNALKATGDVKGLGIAGTSQTLLAIDDQAPLVQAQIDSLAQEFYYLDFVILQGKGEASVQAISAYPNLRALTAPNVSICVAQDPAVAALDAAYAKYADIGSVLGMLAQRRVDENLGSVDVISKPPMKRGNENYPLTIGAKWATATLSDGKKVSELTAAEKQSLTDKGYIWAGWYDGYPGVYFNGSPTCVASTSDYANIENNRVWNKVARAVRNALLPRVKGVVKKDPTTGYIASTTISDWVGRCNKVLDVMVAAEELSGYGVYIDSKQQTNASTPLKVKINAVSNDIVHQFDVDLGLTKTA